MPSRSEKRHHPFHEGTRLLDLRMMAGGLDHLEARARNALTERPTVPRRDDPVAGAPQHEGGHPDATEPPGEPGIVQVRMPRVDAQRLAIARALIGDPKLLILDEATSALDHKTAQEIAKAAHALTGTRTILAITHQALWVDAADSVYEIRDGKVTMEPAPISGSA